MNWEQELEASATVQGFVVSKGDNGVPNNHYNGYQQLGNSKRKLSHEWVGENRQRSVGYVTIITEVSALKMGVTVTPQSDACFD